MIGMRKSVLAALFLFLATAAAAPAGPERSDDLAVRLDRVFAEAYPATGPGAAVIVVQDGKPSKDLTRGTRARDEPQAARPNERRLRPTPIPQAP